MRQKRVPTIQLPSNRIALMWSECNVRIHTGESQMRAVILAYSFCVKQIIIDVFELSSSFFIVPDPINKFCFDFRLFGLCNCCFDHVLNRNLFPIRVFKHIIHNNFFAVKRLLNDICRRCSLSAINCGCVRIAVYLRLALRVSNVDPALAQTQAKAALTDPAGLMQSQDDNMKQTPKRQYIAGGNENIYALLFSWTGNAVLSKEMERAYKNQALKEGAAADAVTFNENSENCYLDPRCEVLWFRPTPFDSLTTSPLPTENLKRDFNGVMNGETNVGGSYLNRYSANRCILSSDAMNKDYWWNLAREIVWMGYAESLFLKAEAALRWPSLVDETAEALYLKGIKASMDYYEIDADKANEYISHLDGVKAFAGGSKEEQLEQIITQKWIAVFPNGNEGWAEVRRTDYPRYLLAPVNGNNSNGEVASGKLIKRINYPNSESRNPNKPGNVNQGSRVWWDVADTMNDRGQWHTPNNFR